MHAIKLVKRKGNKMDKIIKRIGKKYENSGVYYWWKFGPIIYCESIHGRLDQYYWKIFGYAVFIHGYED
jgi:hypothetical protein